MKNIFKELITCILYMLAVFLTVCAYVNKDQELMFLSTNLFLAAIYTMLDIRLLKENK